MSTRFKPILSLGLLLLGSGFFLSTSAVLHADTLKMPDVNSQPPNDSEGVVRPERGLTMDDVKTKYGEPLSIDGPVGNPPITRWTYDKFTVVFESNYVIDSFVPK